jgi:methionine sulfoxide reductase heme-binding subunit
MMIKRLSETQIKTLKVFIFFLSLIPLGRLGWWAYADALGSNPIEKLIRQTGYWTLTFLTITMAVTPLRLWLGLVWLGRFRRMLGLFAFFYSILHLSSYVILDQFFDWMGILKDIAKRPYITVGFTGLMLMMPLALTSSDGMIRRLGGQRWRSLHRLIYLITLLGVIHFIWLVKKDIFVPMTFMALFCLSLSLRGLIKVRTPTSPKP